MSTVPPDTDQLPEVWAVSRIYDSPWALPFLRRNEIAVPVDGIGNRPMNRTRPSPVGNTVASRTRSDAYCQYAENPAVADAVSHVVAAVVAENERVRRS